MARVSDFHPKYAVELIKSNINRFGKVFFLLITFQFFAQIGIIGDLVGNVLFPYYRDAGVSAQTRTEMGIIAGIPANAKSFIGLVTDLFPIAGKRKTYYVYFYLFVGIACCILLGFLPYSIAYNTPILTGLLFLGLQLASSSSDVLFEAKNVELMQKNPTLRSDLLSYCWFCDCTGQLLPNFFVGIIAHYTDVRVSFWVFLPFAFLPLPFLFMGGMIDDESPSGSKGMIDMNILIPQWKLITVAFLQIISAVASIVVTWLGDSTIQLIYSAVTAVIINCGAFILLDLRTAKWFFFLFAYAGLYLDVRGALEYFYTAGEDCFEGGPQFTYIVTNTLAPVINNIVQYVAIFLFQVTFKHWKFRHVFTLTILIRVGCVIADLLIVTRWTANIIPDSITYLFGYACIGTMAFRVHLYVNSYLNAKLCPKNFEATMYSVLTAAGYVGVSLAGFGGVFMMDLFGIDSTTEDGTPCDWSNLALVTLLCHGLIPLISIPLIYVFIPNTKMSELILHDQVTVEPKQLSNQIHIAS